MSRLPVLGRSRTRTVSRSSTNEQPVIEPNLLNDSINYSDLETSQSSECGHRQRSGTIDLGTKPIIGLDTSPDELDTVESEFSSHIGGRVLIGGHKVGILRFFGYVHVREGLYCGVELLEPAGNHDGVLKGKRYFTCSANHGIFAPAAKVELLLPQLNRRDPLITSTYSPVLTTSISMDSSQIQDVSRNSSEESPRLGSPLAGISNAENTADFECLDDIEPPSFLMSSQCQTPCTGSREEIMEPDDDSQFDHVLEPMDLDASRDDEVVTPNATPKSFVIESPSMEHNDTLTITDSTTSIPPDDPMTSASSTEQTVAQGHNGPTDPHVVERPVSAVSVDTGYHGDSDYADVRSTASPRLDTSNEQEEDTAPQDETHQLDAEGAPADAAASAQNKTFEVTPAKPKLNETFDAAPTPKRQPVKTSGASGNKRTNSSSSSTCRPPKKATPTVSSVAKAASPGPSTSRVAMPMPVAPPKPRPPKQISKQQQIMEQLKASMKNDKHKPPAKAEVKSKVMQEIKTEIKKGDTSKDETELVPEKKEPGPARSKLAMPRSTSGLRPPAKRANPMPSSGATTHKKQPLKPSNTAIAKPSNPISRVASKTSSTSSIATPPTTSASTSLHKANASASKTRKVDSGPSAHAKGRTPTSTLPVKTRPAKETPQECINRLQTQLDKQKKELVDARTAVDVLAVTTNFFNEQEIPKVENRCAKRMGKVKNDAQNQINKCKTDSAAKLADRENKLSEIQKKSESTVVGLKQSHAKDIETLTLAHQNEIKKLQNNHEDQLKQKDLDLARVKEEHEEKLKQAKDNFEDEISALKSEHERNVKEVQADHEKDIVKLQSDMEQIRLERDKSKTEKNNLEQELMRDADSKIKSAEKRYENMHKEMTSLQTVLEVRNTEIRQLRPHAEMLPLVQKEVEMKDKEISKLNQKVTELKERFEQQRDAERSMRMDYENMSKSVHKMQNDLDKTALERDELLVRYQASDDDTGSPHLRPASSRVRASLSESEKCASTPPSTAHGATAGGMVRSAISHHQDARRRQQKGRSASKQNGVEVHMYPQGGACTTSLIYDIGDEYEADNDSSPQSSGDKPSPIASGRSAISSTSPRPRSTVDSGIFTSTYSESSMTASQHMTNSITNNHH